MEESLSKQKLTVASDLLADVQVSRLSAAPEQMLRKASRLARLDEGHDIEGWFGFEIRG